LIDFSREREAALPGQNETQQEYDGHLHWSQYHGVQLVVLNQQSLRIVPNARREGNISLFFQLSVAVCSAAGVACSDRSYAAVGPIPQSFRRGHWNFSCRSNRYGLDFDENPPRSFLFRHPVIRQERFLFDPGEIASALLRWHRLAELEKVAKHHGLALGSQPRTLGQRSSDFGRHVRCAGKKRLELHVVRVDFPAHIAALWKVGSMKLGRALEIRVAQVELLLQPSQFRLVTPL